MTSPCSKLVFTEFKNGGQPVGYTGRCVRAYLMDASELLAAGAQISAPLTPGKFSDTVSISSVYVPQTNVFEGALHKQTENYVFRFWDDGRPVMPFNGWEVHDEGDIDPNAATGSWSAIGKLEWLSANDAAALLNLNATEFTPDAFNTIYDEVWSKNHAGLAVPEDDTEEEQEEANPGNQVGE